MNSKETFQSADEIIFKLMELDTYCYMNNIKSELVILGGSGIFINLADKGIEFRPTKDIDVETIATTDIGSFSASLAEFGIHAAGSVIDVPPMEDIKDPANLFKLEGQGFTNIDVFVPSLELLACCKIFSKREKDLNDLKNTDLLSQCNKEELCSLIEEYKQYALNIEDPFLNLYELDNIFNQKGI